MTDLFLKILNMSLSASWVVGAVLLLRLLLRKAPKWTRCLLWGVVALRLLIPFSFESSFSLLPSAEVIPQDIVTSEVPAIHSGVPAVNNTINPLFTLHASEQGNLLAQLVSAAMIAWLVGMAIFLLYSLIAYWRLRRKLRASIPMQEDVYLCDDVETPFVLGVFRPRIYLPSGMDEAQIPYVLAHENAHIRRRDHWWKPFAYCLLTVHWFNPAMWLAYILLCRDIEQACDEKVIAGMDVDGKKGYSNALVDCSVHRRMIMACPVAFGEVGVKTRIKSVLNYKKPAFWITAAAMVICIITALCYLTIPVPCQHEYQSQITIASTCTEKGLETLTCDLCQHSYTQAVDVQPHTYDDGIVAVESTCTKQGSLRLTCTGCGAYATQPLPLLPHTVGGPITIQEANCIHTGQKIATCIYCHTEFLAEVLPVNGVHDLTETVLTEATCTAPGEGVLSCTRCDHSESCTYEQLEHNYVCYASSESTCSWGGYKAMGCTECKDEYWIQLPTKEHSWVTRGKYKVCSKCGWTISSNPTLWFDPFKP